MTFALNNFVEKKIIENIEQKDFSTVADPGFPKLEGPNPTWMVRQHIS